MLTHELPILSERRLLQFLCADEGAAAGLLRAWAEAHRVNIDGAETKADMLAIIASA